MAGRHHFSLVLFVPVPLLTRLKYNKNMFTTTIGSYPYDYKKIGKDAVYRAVQEQLDAGIDLISDGQTRFDMVEYFARSIDGYSYDGKSKVTGKIGRGDPGILLEDLATAQELAPNVKGIVTGPVTLVFASRVHGIYQGFRDKSLYLDTARAILEIAKALEKQGAIWIQIDEPSLSIGAPMDIAREAIESIATNLNVPVALHVCGDVRPIIGELVTYRGIKLLSHGFKGEANLPLLEDESLVSSDKLVGLGCVDTKNRRIESVGEIAEIIGTALKTLPRERLVIHPDCGLRLLDRDTAYAKLTNMVAAARSFD